MLKRKKKGLGSLAISQIIILILGTIAIAYIIGNEVKIVSAAIDEPSGLSFTFNHPTGKIYVKYNQYYSPSTTEGLPNNGESFYFFQNDKYAGATPGAQYVAYDPTNNQVYYYGPDPNTGKTEWNPYLTSDGIGNINFPPSGFPQGESTTTLPVSQPNVMTGLPGTAGEGTKTIGTTESSETPSSEGKTKGLEFKGFPETKIGKWLAKNGIPAGLSAAIGYVIKSGLTALAIWGALQTVKSLLAELGAPDWAIEAADAASYAAAGGFLVRQGLALFISSTASWIIGGVATVIIFLAVFKLKKQKAVIFECVPWKPQGRGGGGKDSNVNYCEKCNENPLIPCSEYQCRSLGQNCRLLNDEESGQAICAWINKDDTLAPEIEADEEVLFNDYSYIPDNALLPPDRGVLISYDKTKAKTTKTIDNKEIGCVPTFTPLKVGIKLNEPAICKIDFVRRDNFENMSFFMSDGFYKEKHQYSLSLPSLESYENEGIEIESGEMSLYIRCKDGNENSNVGDFVFKFCVDEGPDETPPEIVGTDFLNGMPVASGTQAMNVTVYVNEPLISANGGCKWSHNDISYNEMENNMTSCKTSITQVNPQGLYTCKASLSGIKNNADNKFYFRCQDAVGNINSESYEFTIKGSRPLVISSVEPNATTIKGSTSPVKVTLKVETSAGVEDGKATCMYSSTGNEEDYKTFDVTNSYKHTRDLWLAGGSYTYYIMCYDLGGNADTTIINFDVEADTKAPTVVRVYHEDGYLKLVTDEEAECVYDTVNCNYNFEDGIKMSTTEGKIHYTDWETDRNFYIKCKDIYDNQPSPDRCSIIVRPQI